MQPAHDRREALVGVLVQVGDGDARGEARIVRVLRRQVRGRLGGEVIQFLGCHTVVHTLNNLLRDDDRRDRRVERVGELGDARDDLVEHDRLGTTIALHDVHRHGVSVEREGLARRSRVIDL